MNQHEEATFDDHANMAAAINEKLIDASTPGYVVEFAPTEADRAGAFIEDALNETDAAASTADLVKLED